MTSGGPLTGAFEDERDSVPIVGSSEGDGVIIASTLEDLVHALEEKEKEAEIDGGMLQGQRKVMQPVEKFY